MAERPRETAISPVRTISIRPNGRIIRSNASIFESPPVISIVTERFDTSTTVPRKMLANSRISRRDSLSAAPATSREATGGLPTLPHFAPKAKRAIYLHMVGGPSQMDLYDYKPVM